jgi:hypothetical protein
MDDIEYIDNYVYTGITGIKYSPFFKDGKWFICNHEVSLLQLAVLLQIEDEQELVILKLRHGG